MPPAVSRAAAAAELLARRQARAGLIGFTEYTYPRYVVEEFHRRVAQALDDVIEGKIKRLMIFAPPQHGKSELASVRLPAKWIGARPDDPVILASYAASLAHNKSRQTRDVVESQEFRSLYGDLGPSEIVPVKTRDDSRAVHEWNLAHPHRGGMLAVGVGGPITGHGAMLGIIDDPFENWEQAQSPTYRNRAWEWYRTTFRTRIWEDGAIVLIMTRWHQDDLAGRLLKTQGNQWTVLRFPAIAENQEERDKNDAYLGLPTGQPDPIFRQPGEPLAPKRFSLGALQSLKTDVGSMGWAAEYQGVPRPLEGNRFKREWFKIVQVMPADAERIRYWDKAGTADGGAYTAGVLVARQKTTGRVFIEHVVRGQWSALERENIMKQTAILDDQKYGWDVDIYVEQEPGSGGLESAEATIRNLAAFPVYKEPPSGNKDARLEPFAAQAEAGNVYLIYGLWNEDYIEEFATLPNGSYRDQSDATAGAYNKLMESDVIAPIQMSTFDW